MAAGTPALSVSLRSSQALRVTRKALKRLLPLVLGVYLLPKVFLFYVCCGLADVLRNRQRTLRTLDRYFAGNGLFTWLLSPFNLLMDVLTLPFPNRGIYRLADLPRPHQEEIGAVIEAARRRNLVSELETRMAGQKRGMIFFKWYGKDVATSLKVPEFHQPFRYVRTIGVSVFNKKQSTTKHFGPLRVTLRVLYNLNPSGDRSAYIKVGKRTHYWQHDPLFIFDDTLQHQSFNQSDALRCCLFVDILRPGYCSWFASAVLTGVRLLMARLNFVFYQHWTFLN